ncbi:septum formation initiator [Lacinutrix venerupis]|uniref:Septum formation initiator n=1 Tax=Lacinutrix venerupis TaxID=1486034 RepID=A0AAC9PXN8_9FLAO|nr:septum formation initiator family protein [Lacinutrix venerupis]APY00774.1 septum formation initiator [Lacinutrix venerupis]RLJ64423.1 septum formation initiator [Lacinutrix venerupis]
MLKYFKNKFLIIFIGFALWMLFWDSNSLLIHNELNSDIEKLENEKNYYRKEIIKDNKAIKELKKEEGLEKFAREEYYMKRDNEDIYIIEYQDSLNFKTDE